MTYRVTYELDQDLFDDTERALPKPGAVVFGPRYEDWHLNACLNYVTTESQWSWYADGYKTAGDFLAQFADAARGEVDTLIFPVAFNYRQYLELRLKELLMVCSSYQGEKFQLPTHHDLMGLWGLLRPRLASLDFGDEATVGVEHVIREFNKLDVGSFSFRYPVGKDGTTPSLPGITHINLGQLRDRIAEVAWLLDGFSAGMSEYLDQKCQYEAEMRAEAARYEQGW